MGPILADLTTQELTAELLSWLDSEDHSLREVAGAWAKKKLADNGVRWLLDTLDRPELDSQTRRDALVVNVPTQSEFWHALAATDLELADRYWERVTPWPIRAEEVHEAAHELLGRSRPWAAVDVVGLATHGNTEDYAIAVTPDLVEAVLRTALTFPPPTDEAQSLGYQVSNLLDFLEGEDVDIDRLASYEFAFCPLLEHHRRPRALFHSLEQQSEWFVDLVSKVYRGANESPRKRDVSQETVAHHARRVLRAWDGVPGLHQDGTLDPEHLHQWVRYARNYLAEADRADVGDEHIGQILAASPYGDDGLWPHEAVRDLIESTGNPRIETGIHIAAINRRGVTTRSLFEGGQQERAVAERYRHWEGHLASGWPRTARVLRNLAEDLERDAQREDAEARVRSDTQ
jgi:hypothetical protein